MNDIINTERGDETPPSRFGQITEYFSSRELFLSDRAEANGGALTLSASTDTTSVDGTEDTSSATVSEGTSKKQAGNRIKTIGEILFRYGLVTVLLWIGLLKFASYEAQAIAPFVMNSPLTSWMYSIFSIQQAAIIIGLWESAAAVLIAIRPLSARLSAVGSSLAVVVFVLTLSFLFTTPGVWQGNLGAPFLSGSPGGFLLKDAVLLGVAVWTLGEALEEA